MHITFFRPTEYNPLRMIGNFFFSFFLILFLLFTEIFSLFQLSVLSLSLSVSYLTISTYLSLPLTFSTCYLVFSFPPLSLLCFPYVFPILSYLFPSQFCRMLTPSFSFLSPSSSASSSSPSPTLFHPFTPLSKGKVGVIIFLFVFLRSGVNSGHTSNNLRYFVLGFTVS